MTDAPHDLAELVRRAGTESAGRVRAAARLMTLVENEPARLPEMLAALVALAAMPDRPELRLVIGVTGPPGSGKSVLADRLIAAFRGRYPERRLGVIAVDPSSPFTGGALLGDRVRMMRHATDPLVFIRSAAARGRVGGLAAGVRGILRVMGLLGCDVVLIETAGAGQSEVEIVEVADLVVIVLAPGMGDQIQLLKSGLLEAGDLFVVNKADRADARRLYAQILAALPLMAAPRGPREAADVHLVSALEDRGVAELVDRIEHRCTEERDRWAARRARAAAEEVRQAVLEESRRLADRALGADGAAARHIGRVLRGEIGVEGLVRELLVQPMEGAEAHDRSERGGDRHD